VPKTPKGQRAHLALKDAARRVFRESGFANARVADIAAEGGFSNGAFYRYFRDKHEVMLHLLRELLDEAYEVARAPWDASKPRQSVLTATERYLTFYRDNADLFRILVEAAQNDPEVEAMWAEVRADATRRIDSMLRRAVDHGVARADLDTEVSAGLLVSMTDHYAYLWFILGRMPERTIAQVSAELARTWSDGTFTARRRGDRPARR
jgi:AcrR family transcriptional regulator